MRIRLLVTAATLAALVITACGGGTAAPSASAGASATTAGPLPDGKIGLATSKSGAANFYNPQQTQGAQLAVDQFNATGGFHGGRQKIQRICADAGSVPAQGTTAVKKLIEQGKGT